VVALDVARSWFRYDRQLADLLQMELRRSAPVEVIGLHRQAADWFARHERTVQAVQRAQAARDWAAVARLLADHWPAFRLDGQAATVHHLIAGFPAEIQSAYAEVAASDSSRRARARGRWSSGRLTHPVLDAART
jgi:LuxR family maltose regulon positive regulatory protein